MNRGVQRDLRTVLTGVLKLGMTFYMRIWAKRHNVLMCWRPHYNTARKVFNP